jgi:hypothetical protein
VRSNPSLGIMRRFRRETHELILRGGHLSANEVAALEAHLPVATGEREARLALLGSRLAASAMQVAQVHWFIEHEPWTSLGMHGVVTMATGGPRERGVELWRRAIDSHRDDARVIENAVWFFGMVDPTYGAQVVEEHCTRREHDPDAWELMAVYFDFLAASRPQETHEWAPRSFEAALRAFREDKEPEARLGLLASMRATAKSTGKHDALRVLDLADKAHEAGRAAEGPVRDQCFTVAVGLVALADENADRATSHLRAAVEYVAAAEAVDALAREIASRGRADEVRHLLVEAEHRHEECAQRFRAWTSRL